MLLFNIDSIVLKAKFSHLLNVKGIKIIESDKPLFGRLTGKDIKAFANAKKYNLVYGLGSNTPIQLLQYQDNSDYIKLEFHGLQQYNPDMSLKQSSIDKRELLYLITKQLPIFELMKVDYACDTTLINSNIQEHLVFKKNRVPVQRFKGSVYFQTPSKADLEHLVKDQNTNIIVYDKQSKDNLSESLTRLEIGLKIDKVCNSIQDLERLLKAQSERLTKWTNEDVEINNIFENVETSMLDSFLDVSEVVADEVIIIQEPLIRETYKSIHFKSIRELIRRSIDDDHHPPPNKAPLTHKNLLKAF